MARLHITALSDDPTVELDWNRSEHSCFVVHWLRCVARDGIIDGRRLTAGDSVALEWPSSCTYPSVALIDRHSPWRRRTVEVPWWNVQAEATSDFRRARHERARSYFADWDDDVSFDDTVVVHRRTKPSGRCSYDEWMDVDYFTSPSDDEFEYNLVPLTVLDLVSASSSARFFCLSLNSSTCMSRTLLTMPLTSSSMSTRAG